MNEPMEEIDLQVSEEAPETGKTESLEGQTIYVPKQGDDYSIPDQGRAVVSFTKVAEDEGGCTIKITEFEQEGKEPAESVEEDVNNFLDNGGKSYG